MTKAKQFNPFELFCQLTGSGRIFLPDDALRITLFVLVKHSGMTANTRGAFKSFQLLDDPQVSSILKSRVCGISTNNTRLGL